MNQEAVLFTGGSGLLGREMRGLAPHFLYPTSAEFNVTDREGMERYLSSHPVRTIVHAAAFTSPPAVDKDPAKAVAANIIGTGNLVELCIRHGIRLIYVSTDYVFSGEKGMYGEEDPVRPVNKYAWSKLGGECAVRLCDNSLIVRTSFGPNRFPYEKAFVDQYTSRQSVADFAAKLLRLTTSELRGVIHVGGPRRTVHEYALSLDPTREIGRLSVTEVSFRVPIDTSLDTRRWATEVEGRTVEPAGTEAGKKGAAA